MMVLTLLTVKAEWMVVFTAVVDWLVADEVSSTLFLGELGSTIVEVRKGGGDFDDFRVIGSKRKLIPYKNIIP